MVGFPFGRPLPQSFYDRDTLDVARELLGCVFVNFGDADTVAGVIVETEAYLWDDPASHSFGGLRTRNKVMFGHPGHLYTYLIYGVNWCANAVTRPESTGEAVLIRALEPICGIGAMQLRRGPVKLQRLCSGPGCICQALQLTGEQYGYPLFKGDVQICGPAGASRPIVQTTRIGLTKAADKPWRFYLADSKCVSRKVVGVRVKSGSFTAAVQDDGMATTDGSLVNSEPLLGR